MTEESYWIRLGTRTEGPLTRGEIRLRATRGSLSQLHMISRDRTNWKIASSVRDIFNADGSVASTQTETELSILDPQCDLLDMESSFVDGADSAVTAAAVERIGFKFGVVGRLTVAPPWILVPAWLVIAVAAVMPIGRSAGESLHAWQVGELSAVLGWRGAASGVLWLFVLLSTIAALAFFTWSRGRVRAIAGLTCGWIAIAVAMITLSIGAGTGLVSGSSLILAAAAVRLLDANEWNPRDASLRAVSPSLTLTQMTIGLSLAVIVLLTAVGACFGKGLPFLAAGILVLVACATFFVAGMLAGGEKSNRRIVFWLAVSALLFGALAVLAEGITAHLLGAPRLAVFEAVRALSVTALASICAYVAFCELRFIDPSEETPV